MLTSRMIEAFRFVVMNGSMSSAAAALHVSQPAVSRLIRDLEIEVGFQLFDRRRGRVYPKEEALAFYEVVHQSFVGLNRIAQAAEQIRAREAGALRIACLPAIGLSIMPGVIARLRKRHPEITVSFKVVRSETAVQLVSSQQCDIAVVEASFSALSVIEGETYDIASVCVLPPKHRLVHLETISPKDLEDEVFIALDPDSRTRLNIEAAFETVGARPPVQVETPLTNMACALVLEGCGVSIVDPMTAATFAHQGLVARPFHPEAKFSFHALTSSSVRSNPVADSFFDEFSNAIFRRFLP